MPRYTRLRDRLKKTRKARGLNPSELARQAGLSHTAIKNIEEGRSIPGVVAVEQLADALGVSPAWLAFGEDAEGMPDPAEHAQLQADYQAIQEENARLRAALAALAKGPKPKPKPARRPEDEK